MRLLIGILAVCALCSACSPKGAERGASEWPGAEIDALSGERALEKVGELVALGLRDSGTEGALRAANWIASELRELGLVVEIDEFEDAIPGGRMIFRNVIGRIPGTGSGAFVYISHYDTKIGMPEGFEGANDSGSSTGLLIEMARVLMMTPNPPAEIIFVFTDGEECRERYGPIDGLHGSRRLALRLLEERDVNDYIGALVLDMVGDRDLTVTLPRNCDRGLLNEILEASHIEQARSKFKLYQPILDDHVPLMNAGIAAANIIDFEYGSAPGRNDYWHSAEDTMDKLSADSLELIGRIALRVLNSSLAEQAD